MRAATAAALAALAALAAAAAVIVPALATPTGAHFTIWEARGLPGLMSALWLVQIAVAAIALSGAALVLARRRVTAVVVLAASWAASLVVLGRLWTYPRHIGTPPLEPARGMALVAFQCAGLIVACALVAGAGARNGR